MILFGRAPSGRSPAPASLKRESSACNLTQKRRLQKYQLQKTILEKERKLQFKNPAICTKFISLPKNYPNNTKNEYQITKRNADIFLAHTYRLAHHPSRCTLYLFGFSEKKNPKRMPLHRGEVRGFGV